MMFAWVLSLTVAGPTFGEAKPADGKTLQRIQQDVELVPSLYAAFQGAPNLKGMPKFTPQKLAEWAIDDAQTADKERQRFAGDREKYAKDHPLRAIVFEAAEEMEQIAKLNLRMTLVDRNITPKLKAAMLEEQKPIGMAMFRLEQVLVRMKEADDQRAQEKSPRWTLAFDFARTRIEGNLVFLYEYNFTLAKIRTDNLPELRKDDAGWRINFDPTLHVLEQKAKAYAKERSKRLSALRKQHAETPWAFFADVEGGRLLGMTWAPAKE